MIGKDECYRHKQFACELNYNRVRIIDFDALKKLVVKSTIFKCKGIHKVK